MPWNTEIAIASHYLTVTEKVFSQFFYSVATASILLVKFQIPWKVCGQNAEIILMWLQILVM